VDENASVSGAFFACGLAWSKARLGALRVERVKRKIVLSSLY